jgi:hypothetical protein
VKDLELERARARDTMIILLCSASVITLVGLDSQWQNAGVFANIGVIVCALVGATISGMQWAGVIDPSKAPWWAYAAFFLFLLVGLFIDVRRLRAMASSSGDLTSATERDS